MKFNTKDKDVLLHFLKSGLSTRQLDNMLGHDSVNSKGFKSWKILKKYNIQDKDKNKLFCFRKQESLAIIKGIMVAQDRKKVDIIFKSTKPKFFEKYRDIYIVTNSDLKVLTMLSGEVRNITQSFFSPLKKIVTTCQFPECNRNDLDTVHLQKSRPDNLKIACDHGYISGTEKYDVYKILLQYIHLHSKKNSLCFLCKKHHVELSVYEKMGGKRLTAFRRQIISDIEK